MKESLIEADGVKYAEARGWLVYKWASPGNRGLHDRIHFKNGVTFTIEYKSTGKKATAKQRRTAIELGYVKIPCRCCDNVQDARNFINNMNNLAARKSFLNKDQLLDVLDNIPSFDP